MIIKISDRYLICKLVASLMLTSFFSIAEDNLQFKGSLIVPNCIINNDNAIEVDFGDVEIQSLTDANTPYHGRDFNVPINCPYTIGAPKLNVSSSMVYNSQNGVLRTSKYQASGEDEGLVVYLRKSGGRGVVKLNEFQDVSDLMTGTISNAQKILTLHAALGREKPLADLTPGPFTSSANMVVKYE